MPLAFYADKDMGSGKDGNKPAGKKSAMKLPDTAKKPVSGRPKFGKRPADDAKAHVDAERRLGRSRKVH